MRAFWRRMKSVEMEKTASLMTKNDDDDPHPIIILEDKEGLCVEIVLADSRWRDLWSDDFSAKAKKAIRQCLKAGNIGACEITLLCADDEYLMALNTSYRGKAEPTNVLSFSDSEPPSLSLGDIAIAYELSRGEAKALSIPFEAHVLHLIVHGVLHLLGHDHESSAEAKAMESLEVEILGRLGISDPYRPYHQNEEAST